MADRFVLKDAYDPPEVELAEGHVFVIRELTKHLEQELGDSAQKVFDQLDVESPGVEFVDAIGKFLDVVLERLETENGATPRSKPSTLLKKGWDANELSAEKLTRLFLFVRGVEVPPT